ncbi:hypothetical protein FOA43_003889 [Brettanomyces nanus]|uniref:Protein STB3 n=1 Tax=Eeniella nana TaxID=13502 RepID=A0A875RQC4_EENNA|nr:uncharacterized protein FOA43_003889 [Brettanomyces nanus]QPG76500.1 hypothetical protein FOA43_003889 [Brettanomyces nanus]
MHPRFSNLLDASPEPENNAVASSSLSKPLSSKPKPKFVTSTNKAKKTSRSKSTSIHSSDDGYLISTSSPEGIAAASQITPGRIARILLSEGPLPIRHLTAQLVAQVPSFGHLSLSKQRRLIMTAMDSGDSGLCCIFDKIGWGQWEAKIVTRDEFNKRAAASAAAAVASSSSSGNSPSTVSNNASLSSNTIHRRKNSNRDSASPGERSNALKAIKKEPRQSSHSPVGGKLGSSLTSTLRRESITNPKTDLHNTKVPRSPSLLPLQSLRNSFKAHNLSLDEAIESSSDEDGGEEAFELNSHGSASSGSSPGNEENGIFNFEDQQQQQRNKKVPRSSSLSSSNSRRPSFRGVAKPGRKPRSSFTSHSIEAALDEGVMENRRPLISFSNPSSIPRQSFLRTSISPRTNPIMMHEQMSSLSIASSVASNEKSRSPGPVPSLPTKPRKGSVLAGTHIEGDTDEEDWEAIGPKSLRKGNHSADGTNDEIIPQGKDKEMTAAIALINLRTVN